METKEESPIEMPQSLKEAMNKQARYIVDYLQEITDILDENFVKLMLGREGAQIAGRLFFDLRRPTDRIPPSSRENMEKFFSNEELIAYAVNWIVNFKPIISEESKKNAKDFIENLFSPIEKSNEWQVFYQSLINKFGPDDAQALTKKLTGALFFKMQGPISRAQTILKEKKDASKDKLLIKFFNKYPNMDVVLEDFKTSLRKDLENIKKPISERVIEVRDSRNIKTREAHASALRNLMKTLPENLDHALKDYTFTTQEPAERNKFLLTNVVKLLWEIRFTLRDNLTKLNKYQEENETLLKECEAYLADCVIKIFSEHNQHGELTELGWDQDLLILAQFAIQPETGSQKLKALNIYPENEHEAYLEKYEAIIELFKTKVQDYKQAKKVKPEIKQPSFFKPDETEEGNKEKRDYSNQPPSYLG
ncbi:hypothetical protein [Legionella gresilensis]|uniref:hypothetical protein n=1 Tax=Legionella gresilensis TaxID=91823 RepID=UPI001041B5D5|nr:hypothetical protein [Legionella gresilensis]